MFRSITESRWQAFDAKTGYTIIESALLQNLVTELLFFRCLNEDETITFINRLVSYIEPFPAFLIYLSQPDIGKTIRRIAEERTEKYESGKTWLEIEISRCENTPFGKNNNIRDFDGMMKLIAIRKRLEMRIVEQLSIPHVVIDNVDYDWDFVWSKIESQLYTLTSISP